VQRTKDLVATASSGGEAGRNRHIEDLYERHVPAATRFAYLLTGDRAGAEDLAQDAFLRCVRRLAHLRVPDRFDVYLRRAIVNLHLSAIRHRSVERAWLVAQGPHEASRMARQPDVAARQDMWHRLQSLPARQRAAIVLRYYEDLSEHQTAQVLHTSVASVKALVARGMGALRAVLEGEEPEA